MAYTIVIADDHSLFTEALSALINSFDNYEVLYTVANGKELTDRLKIPQHVPDLILLDINMPIMNGLEAMQVIKNENIC